MLYHPPGSHEARQEAIRWVEGDRANERDRAQAERERRQEEERVRRQQRASGPVRKQSRPDIKGGIRWILIGIGILLFSPWISRGSLRCGSLVRGRDPSRVREATSEQAEVSSLTSHGMLTIVRYCNRGYLPCLPVIERGEPRDRTALKLNLLRDKRASSRRGIPSLPLSLRARRGREVLHRHQDPGGPWLPLQALQLPDDGQGPLPHAEEGRRSTLRPGGTWNGSRMTPTPQGILRSASWSQPGP